MTSVSHDDVEPVTDYVHENSWSANLEKPHHAEDRSLVRSQTSEAIDHTASGNHVNLVTHAEHGHPGEYLYEHIEAEYGDDVDYEYVQQCGCGGHVTKAHVQ